jgi:hypothetical protein
LNLVKAALEEAVRDCFERRPPPPIGVGRMAVRDRLRKMLADQERKPAQRRHRLLKRTEFDRLCDEVGGVSDKEALLDFLHHNGVVFYRAGTFGGRIVLDQNWALKAMYALFDRKKILPLLRGYGRFNRADLEALIWSGYTPAEQEIFLSMMESCGICFRLRKLPHDPKEGGENGSTLLRNYSPNGQTRKSCYLVGCAMILRTRRRLHAMLFSTRASCAVISPNLVSTPKTRPFTGNTAAGSTSERQAVRR